MAEDCGGKRFSWQKILVASGFDGGAKKLYFGGKGFGGGQRFLWQKILVARDSGGKRFWWQEILVAENSGGKRF